MERYSALMQLFGSWLCGPPPFTIDIMEPSVELLVFLPKEFVGSHAIKGPTAVEMSGRGVASIWPSAHSRSVLGAHGFIQEWLDVTDGVARRVLCMIVDIVK